MASFFLQSKFHIITIGYKCVRDIWYTKTLVVIYTNIYLLMKNIIFANEKYQAMLLSPICISNTSSVTKTYCLYWSRSAFSFPTFKIRYFLLLQWRHMCAMVSAIATSTDCSTTCSVQKHREHQVSVWHFVAGPSGKFPKMRAGD